jgi:hypothetical protein
MSSASDLLASAAAPHRRAVASQHGLAPGAAVDEIAAALRDRDRLATVVDGLSEEARRMVARAAFHRDPDVCGSWSGRPDPGACELERHGLAFAFRHEYELEYHVPHDLHGPLADVLAAPYYDGLERSEPARWLAAPMPLAHDLAALWAHLARAPVRVKADGPVYQRDTPKLLAALPALDLHGLDDPIATYRLRFVLDVLLEEELAALRVDNLPGSSGRRELVATGDPLGLLARDPADLRARLLDHVGVAPLGAAALALVGRLEPEVAVTLTSFGSALRRICDGLWLDYDLPTSDFSLGMGALHFVWLAGGVAVGVDQRGVPEAVRAVSAPAFEPGRFVCQANFELVALAPPSPAERLVLALTCDRVPDQDHVFRLTRESVRAAERCGILAGGALATIELLAGELPQNVKRSLAGWTGSVSRPLKLRSALLLDTGDVETAEALLAGPLAAHVVERVAPTQLAIRGSAIADVRDALRAEGHELDPGIERISGRWSERDPTHSEADHVWTPRRTLSEPVGKQSSTIGRSPQPPQATLGRGPELQPVAHDEPIDVVLRAIEQGSDVFIAYASADGTTERQITPYEIDGAAVRAYCHLHRDERSFWLASIVDALALDD